MAEARLKYQDENRKNWITYFDSERIPDHFYYFYANRDQMIEKTELRSFEENAAVLTLALR